MHECQHAYVAENVYGYVFVSWDDEQCISPKDWFCSYVFNTKLYVQPERLVQKQNLNVVVCWRNVLHISIVHTHSDTSNMRCYCISDSLDVVKRAHSFWVRLRAASSWRRRRGRRCCNSVHQLHWCPVLTWNVHSVILTQPSREGGGGQCQCTVVTNDQRVQETFEFEQFPEIRKCSGLSGLFSEWKCFRTCSWLFLVVGHFTGTSIYKHHCGKYTYTTFTYFDNSDNLNNTLACKPHCNISTSGYIPTHTYVTSHYKRVCGVLFFLLLLICGPQNPDAPYHLSFGHLTEMWW